MLKGQRKVNSFGRASCVGLLALSLLAANPIVGNAVYAYDSAPGDSGTGNTGNDSGSSVLTSTVNISFTPESGSASLTPISANGASARYSIKATVGVENSGGYTVYLGSNKSELTGKNTGTTINGVTSSVTYEELPLNSWGYNAEEGETPGTIFSKVPTNNRGDVIASNNSTNIKEDEKTFTLSFAAHIGNDKPADTYENEITLSVVSSPLEITGLTSITNMQEMTSEICEASEPGDTKQLIDLRDSKSYWVAKLPDNNCWMVQNLDLDLGTEWPDASLSDYDVASTAYKPVATATTHTAAVESLTGTSSWDFGKWVINNPTVSSTCGLGKNNLATCTSQFTNVEGWAASKDIDFTSSNGSPLNRSTKLYDAHYLVGNHYQWNTATAGTGGTITSGQASGSICPKGWRLPSSNSVSSGSFGGLVEAGSIGTDVAKLNDAPYYFVRAGIAYQNNNLFGAAGDIGGYWSSTPTTSSSTTYRLDFSGASTLNPSDNNLRRLGYSVRCIAR